MEPRSEMHKNVSGPGIHHLKSWPQYYELVRTRKMPYEVRLDDREFREGDKITIHEWDPERAKEARICDGYTGCSMSGTITCITNLDVFLHNIQSAGSDVFGGGYVVLGVEWDHL